MKSIYEQVGGTYTRQGDYEFPDLKVPPEKEIEIGVWGQRYRRYLKQHHRIRYYNLLTAGTLNGHLAEVDQQAEWMFQSLVFMCNHSYGKYPEEHFTPPGFVCFTSKVR